MLSVKVKTGPPVLLSLFLCSVDGMEKGTRKEEEVFQKVPRPSFGPPMIELQINRESRK